MDFLLASLNCRRQQGHQVLVARGDVEHLLAVEFGDSTISLLKTPTNPVKP